MEGESELQGGPAESNLSWTVRGDWSDDGDDRFERSFRGIRWGGGPALRAITGGCELNLKLGVKIKLQTLRWMCLGSSSRPREFARDVNLRPWRPPYSAS